MNRFFRGLFLTIAGLVSGFVVIAALSYIGPDTSVAAGFLTKLNLPVGMYNGKVVFAREVTTNAATRADMAKLLEQWQESNVEMSLLRRVDLDKSFCDEMGMDIAVCLKYGWIQSQSMNTSGHAKSRQVMQKLTTTDFAEVAKNASEDEATRVFGGEAGMVRLDAVLPEFASQLRDVKEGETGVVASRHGLHVVKVKSIFNHAEDKTKIYELSEIFIKADTSYADWLRDLRNSEKMISFVD